MSRKSRLSMVFCTAVALAAGPRAICAQTPAAPIPQSTQRDLQQLESILNDDAVSQSQRDEAARRLVSRRSEEARQVLGAALSNFGNRGGQLAVARALTDDPRPDRAFIVPLFALLGSDKPLTDAAIAALSEYKTDSDVLSRLITVALARQQRETVRISTIRALGRFVEKRAAHTLFDDLLGREDESPTVRNAAADALAEMTGLRENERDTQRWRQWWEGNRDKSDADFKADLLASRATRYDQLQLRYAQLIDDLQTTLSEQYQAAPEAQKPDILTRYLKNAQPELRAVGARIIYDDSINNRTIPAAVRELLRSAVGDSSVSVRREVARALRAINDEAAVDPLLTQLRQEPDADVRAAIALALAPIRDLRAVPELISLLKDPSFRAADAAAEALKELGPLIREKSPDLAAKAATALRQVMETRAIGAGSGDLRESCIEAIAPLRRAEMVPVFLRLLQPSESIRVRRGALRALGELHDPRAADGIVASLDDVEASVRLEAVIALGKADAAEHAEKLYRRLDPNVEADSSVQKQAWLVLESLMPDAPKEQLAQWADHFRDQPERRRTVLTTLATKLQAEKDEEQLAIVRQNIGETLMKLNQPAEATTFFRQALEYWKPRPGMVSEGLIGQLMDSLLRSRQYTDATAFASSLIESSAAHQQTVGPRIRAEVERLKESGDLESALALIGQANKMTPPLASLYLEQLQTLENEIRQRLPEKPKPASGPQSMGWPWPNFLLFMGW